MLCTLHWSSGVLGKQTATTVLIPEASKFQPPFATFYLLHGLSDDHTIWMRRTRIEHYAAQYPLVIVMPDGYRGFYVNNAQGPAYATHIAQELVEVIERTFPVRKNRASRAIGGLSMGGYGALRLGLGYPELFASVTSHSGAVMHGSRNGPRKDGPLSLREFQRIFGQKPTGTDNDLVALARKVKRGGKLPKIRIDCGTEDFLIEDNRELHRQLLAMKLPHEYEEFPGEHNWDFWDARVREALRFHAMNLRLDV